MKKYNVEVTDRFKKLYKYTQKIIRGWINKNLIDTSNPRNFGTSLSANRIGQWRYRIGNYRIICNINDNKLIILALTVGHRRNVYK